MLILGLVFRADFILAVDDANSQGSSGGEFKKVGAAGGQFLKIGVGARANGMGGAYASLANDLSSVHWNPAGIADINGLAAEFHYTSWFAGMSHNFAALGLPVGENFAAAISFISFASDDIPITTLNVPEGNGNYTYKDLAIGATFSGYLTEQFSFGLTAKYVNSAFKSVASSGFTFDVGTKYVTGIQGIVLGFSIHNLGTSQNYEGVDLRSSKKLIDADWANPLDVQYVSNDFSVPLAFRAGVSGNVYEEDDHRLTAAADFLTLSDTPEQFSLGAEYSWREFLALRVGYQFGHDQFGLGGGIGLIYEGSGFDGEINYSASPTYSLGLVNRIGIRIKMTD